MRSTIAWSPRPPARLDLVDRDPVDRSLKIHPIHDAIDVELLHDRVEIDPIDHDSSEVDPVEDDLDDRREQDIGEPACDVLCVEPLSLASLIDARQ